MTSNCSFFVRLQSRVRTGLVALAIIQVMLLAPIPVASQVADLNAEYHLKVKPLMKRFCLDCHSTERQKGDLDLERFDDLPAVRRDPKVWQKIIEQLGTNEMPPKDKAQPTELEKSQLAAWSREMLDDLGRSQAGDPGPVVLRRLSNAEYTYTIRDLTGINEFDPAREFPVDGAAGEGFMNTGNSLVMSPSLFTKYFDAGKDIASHVVLLPDGFRFSPSATRRDWTDELVRQIKTFYARFANSDGAIPLDRYIGALASAHGSNDFAAIAGKEKLNERYLRSVSEALSKPGDNLILAELSRHQGEPTNRANRIREWQKALWKFNNVGHMKKWLEPRIPVTEKQEFRLKFPTNAQGTDVAIFLHAGDAGDGNTGDFVIWEDPKIVTASGVSIPLKDLRQVTLEWLQRRDAIFSNLTNTLSVVAQVARSKEQDLPVAAARAGADPRQVSAWLDYLGGGITNYSLTLFTNQLTKIAGHEFVSGWGSMDTPNLVANSSDEDVRVPGNVPAHTIAIHPSPKLQAVIGWAAPESMLVRIKGSVVQAHPECGNGVTWSLQLRRGATRQQLAGGVADGGKEKKFEPEQKFSLQAGDLVSLLVGPRDGNHSCDLTSVDLDLMTDDGREWRLRDLADDILAGNPRADKFGNDGVWHFYTEPEGATGTVIPSGSILARWQFASDESERAAIAASLQELLVGGIKGETNTPDSQLYRHIVSLGGPLVRSLLQSNISPDDTSFGVDPVRFGRHPSELSIPANDLCVQAPSTVKVQLPAELAFGCELVTTGRLHPESAENGTVQLQALAEPPKNTEGARPELPFLVAGSAARARLESAFTQFRDLFPAAICYPQVVPVDEVITLTLFHREDDHLARLMLTDEEKTHLDLLWTELRYVSQDAFATVDAFGQLLEYASQDSDPKLFEPFRGAIESRAENLRQSLRVSEPFHLEKLLRFAGKAYRRPLSESEETGIRKLYGSLREEGLVHEEAFRMTLARVFSAPAFLYRLEEAPSGALAGPVSNHELATRLSYFLWSSAPDEELSRVAIEGRLTDSEILVSQARRMLRDPKVRRLAIEFGCQWLHVHGFDQFDEKSERHFPTFNALRDAIYEEPIQFFTDLFKEGRSILNILDADYTFLNGPLAEFYHIPNVQGDDWRKVDGVRQFSRGGVLAFAATLAKQSGASRTSPILRGNWVMESILGEKLPRPPKDVPQLPEEENSGVGLTVRQLVEKHSSDPKCSSCHERLDPYGFALEHYDAIGRWRERDAGDLPINAKTKLMKGPEVNGMDGLRQYLVQDRRDSFARQFCRKLLGYSLGRAVQLSDGPLLAEMESRLKDNDFRFTTLVEAIVQSPQFRQIRGRDAVYEDNL